jgi:subtilisin family serine protease
VRTNVVPNALSLPGIPAAQQAPEDLTDYDGVTSQSTSLGIGHGTGVASVAAGLTLGVASNVNLMLIKATNGRQLLNFPTFPDGSPRFLLAPAKPSAIIWAWRSAISDALQNNAGNPFMKAVINFSASAFLSP